MKKPAVDMIGIKPRTVIKLLLLLLPCCILAGSFVPACAIDSAVTQRTLTSLKGVYMICEDFQPNILKYEKYLVKAGLTKSQLLKDLETKLKAAGIKLLSSEEWLKTPGKPAIYVSINTHENEKYWFAYDIKLELRQMVSLEANPGIKTLAPTWSLNMTGEANIGTFQLIRNNVGGLIDRFIQAYKAANDRAASGR